MKTSKKILIVWLLASLVGAAPTMAQTEVKEQLVVPLTDPNKVGTLQVSLVTGSISVTGYSGKEVLIDASTKNPNQGTVKERNIGSNTNVSVNLNTNQNVKEKSIESNGMKRISPSGGGLEITAKENNNTIKVSSGYVNRAVHLSIKVPTRFSLKLSTVNQGDIMVENVNGELEVTNVNGKILLTNVSGSAVANTINGNLIANFKDTVANPMAFSTLNGNVDVSFPPGIKANFKLKSDRGEIFSDFDMDIDSTKPKATRTEKDGLYKVSIEDWVYGKTNGGGPEVMMKNMHGTIYIRKSK